MLSHVSIWGVESEKGGCQEKLWMSRRLKLRIHLMPHNLIQRLSCIARQAKTLVYTYLVSFAPRNFLLFPMLARLLVRTFSKYEQENEKATMGVRDMKFPFFWQSSHKQEMLFYNTILMRIFSYDFPSGQSGGVKALSLITAGASTNLLPLGISIVVRSRALSFFAVAPLRSQVFQASGIGGKFRAKN